MISKVNLDKLFQTKRYLKIILKEGFRIIEENKNDFNIYNSLFKRYIYNFESINVLIKDFDLEKRYRELPLAIVLRASLLDYLITLYLGTYQAEKKINSKLGKEYNIIIDKLISEQIRRMISFTEKDKQTNFYDHDANCEAFDYLKEKYPNLFNPKIAVDYNKPSKSLIYQSCDNIKNSVIRNRLDSIKSQLDPNIRYEDVFYIYDLYSKYDHFGSGSMYLEYTDINVVCGNILAAIFHICDGIGFCIDLMIEEFRCKSDTSELNHHLSLLRGTIHSKNFWISEDFKYRNQ